MVIRILLAVDPASERRRLQRLLDGPGVDTEPAPSRDDLWERLRKGDFDLVLLGRERITAVESFVASIRAHPDRPEVIVLSPDENAGDRASLLTAGCLAVLPRSLSDSVLRETLRSLVARSREEAIRKLRSERPEESYSLEDFVSLSPAMQAFMQVPRRVAAAEASLLILGETGVGKERLARALHRESPRVRGPFLAVNCGALPESLLESELFGHEEGAFTGATRARKGYFELAHRGTLFLDEIGEMPLHLQVKLLRVLEDRTVRKVGGEREIRVDVRIMAASNRDLETETRAQRFRPDLYYRLAVVTLHVPPLRERREDIPLLVSEYIGRFRIETNRRVTSIHPDALAALAAYDWPGNVRELINVVELACLLAPSEEIRLANLPARISGLLPARGRRALAPTEDPLLDPVWLDRPLRSARVEAARTFERAYLETLLRTTRGRIGRAAERAGINERSLYDLMKRNGIRKESFR